MAGDSLKISLIESGKIDAYRDALDSHLSQVFGEGSTLVLNDEFVCAAIVGDNNHIVAAGLAYFRLMKQGGQGFNAGIIGGIAVDSEYRGQGLGKAITSVLDQFLSSRGVNHAFLFAYKPDVYRSSGYTELTAPIHYYDVQQQRWNQFVYRGGMVKALSSGQPLTDQVIEFNGCVY